MDLIEVAKFTDNVEEMSAFYRNLLGAEPLAQSPDMVVFASRGVRIFIHRRYAAAPGELPPEDHIAFQVQAVDETLHELEGRGLTPEVHARDYYWGRSAYFRDPDGNLVEITRPNE